MIGAADAVDVVLVGAGPRGLILLQQLAEARRSAPGTPAVHVLVCDPAGFGSGAVWPPDQPGSLLMNGTARATTVYQHREPGAASTALTAGPTLDDWMAEQGRSARLSRTDGYASRAAFGEYLRAAYARLRERSRPWLRIDEHPGEVVAAHPGGDGWTVTLAGTGGSSGRRVHARAVVLATGHAPSRPSARQTERRTHAAAHPGAFYLPAALPSRDDYAAVPGDAPAYLEGLGLAFFDAVAMLTEERGGRWTGDGYLPGGREPRLLAGSRRGLPFLGRSRRFRPRPSTDQGLARALERTSARDDVDLAHTLSPEIDRVLRNAADAALDRLCALPLDEGLRNRTETWTRLPFLRWPHADSLEGVFPGRDPHERILGFLADQVELERWGLEAGETVDPRQRVAEHLAPLRNRLRALVPGLRLTGASYARDLAGVLTPLSSFIATGPPMLRIEQVLALGRAGMLRFVGAAEVVADDAGFALHPRSPDGAEPLRVRALIEARVPDIAADRSAGRLLRGLIDDGVAAVHRRDGVSLHGLAVAVPSGRVLGPGGATRRGLFAFGIPTEGVYWNTVAGPISDSEHPIFTSARELADTVLEDLHPRRHAPIDPQGAPR